MVVDGDFIEFQLIKKMYDFVCEKYKEKNIGAKPFLVMFKEFEVLCGFESIDDIKLNILKSFVVLRKVACYQCEAKIGSKRVATAYFGLGEYNG